MIVMIDDYSWGVVWGFVPYVLEDANAVTLMNYDVDATM